MTEHHLADGTTSQGRIDLYKRACFVLESKQFQEAQAGMSRALSRLMLVVERYPDLKANQNFQDLQHQLEGTENRINVARCRYNKAVEVLNTSIQIFPNNLTNKFLLHLTLKEPFKAEAGDAKAPQVKF